MKFLVDNWTLLVILVVVAFLAVRYVKRFSELPSEVQLQKVKEWLLWAVIFTEKELGTGTGVAKLRYCYDLFIQRFPSLVAVISFELFSKYVDEALEKMKHLLETNADIAAYVMIDDKKENQ